MRITPFIIFLLSCATEKTNDTSVGTEYTYNTLSQQNAQTAARWRGIKMSQQSFTGFGKMADGGLRVHTGMFVAQLPTDGQLHLKHSLHHEEVLVSLESWGKEGDMRFPEFQEAKLGKCISDVLGQPIKTANKAYARKGKCVEQAEQVDNGIEAWWRGGLDSLEQGWTIHSAPTGSDLLTLTIAFDGATINKVQQDMVQFTDQGDKVWTYDGLTAWDANGQALDAWFEPGEEGTVSIVVDDSNAQYPITVDPWFSTTGNEVRNTVVNSAGSVVTGNLSSLTATTYRPTNGQNWTAFSLSSSQLTLTNENVFGSFSCPYGTVSGSWESGARVWNGGSWGNPSWDASDNGWSQYRCGDLGDAGNFTWTSTGGDAAKFGTQVHPLGDTNNDTYGDILVTAPEWTTSTYTKRGRVFIFRGSASGLETSPIASMVGQTDNDQFGNNVLTGDDINGDGYNDIVVAASASDTNGTDSGKIYMYFGSAAGISTSAAGTVSGNEADANFGAVMDWAGDVNGDGFADLIIGNRNHDTTGTNMGAAYLYYGSAGGFGSAPSVVWYGAPTVYSASSAYNYDYFGYDVAGIGDINGDGYDDVAVSAPYHDSNGADAGKVYIYLGSANGISSTANYARYGSDSDYFGMDLKKIGDINGDGYAELYVDGYVWFGSATGIAGIYDTQLNITRWMGDVDDDGYDDVMYNNALCFGDSDGTLTCDSARSNAKIVEDITGDGFYDYISADPTYDSNKGRIYTYLAFEPDEDLDGYLASEDCDDEDASINPSAIEICDGIDNDCDDLIDDDDTVDTSSGTTFYADTDDDGFGDLNTTTLACSVPAGYVANSNDCDDTSALAKPGGRELPGDGVDQDCDGGDLCFADYDNDGYRSTGGTTIPSNDLDCADPGEASAATPATDCDDLNPSINPAATETPDNGVDEDCNGGETCYVDADNDGYRTNDGATVPSNDMDCLDAGEGASAEPATDCDDSLASVHPGVNEIVGDGIDQNCDGGDVCYADADDDGFRAIGGLTVPSADLDCTDAGEALNADPATDCNDNDAAINPGVSEIPGDEFDQNCDGTEVCYTDADGDGFRGTIQTTVPSADLDCRDVGEAPVAMPATDCDDADANKNPNAVEVVGDNLDQNCDGREMCFVDFDSDNYRNIDTTQTVLSADADCNDAGEGALAEPATDCNDLNASQNPGMPEIIVDGIDQDCDGGDACYADADGDGERDANNATVLSADADCNDAGEAGSAVPATDCDDSNPQINAAAIEIVGDGIDQNCNGTELCYVDADNDGFRTNNNSTVVSADLVCDGVGEAVVADPATDCNDADPSIYVGAVEIVGDGIDQNCDGTELCYADADNDGYLDATGATVVSLDMDCLDAGEGSNLLPMTDCDDSDGNVYPGSIEVVDNGIDDDCDGREMCYADVDNDGFRDANGGLVVSVDLDCLDSTEGRSIDPATDCNDSVASINPNSVEIVGDGIDQNCNGGETCYVDADNDGYREMTGLTIVSTDMDCNDVGEGSIAEPATDCNDNSAYAYPGATETIADGVDQDCDGGDTCYVDADDDGYRSANGATIASSDLDCNDIGESDAQSATDCNDLAYSVHPGATEIVDNGVDEDCDGGDTCYIDVDNDGYREMTGALVASTDLDCSDPGEGSSSDPSTDCNDNNPFIHPSMIEQPSDGIDSNCDGAESCYEDYDNDGFRAMNNVVIPSIDADCDDPGEGSQFEPATDCNDLNAAIYPSANEVVADGIDQNCDGGDMCYLDADGDGYRGADNQTNPSADLDCADYGEASAAVPNTDCDDSNAQINVDATEIVADGIDQNCDGQELCYVDADNDGYREMTGIETVISVDMDCQDAGEGAAEELSIDCDDASASTYPGATEIIADGKDQNCDGVEICYADMDADGYRTFEQIQSADLDCDDQGEAYADMPIIDCNDQIAAINPAQEEVIDDGIDNNCDGVSETSGVTTEPSTEPSEPSTEPSAEPTTEPSSNVDGETDTTEKSGCSTSSSSNASWIFLLASIPFLRRRKNQ